MTIKLNRPIGIFDAGIGSYAIVERVRARFPQQDILYFADRASFPYGAKTPSALLESVHRATQFLTEEGCVAVVLASNAPSVVVLEPLRAAVAVPVIGVFPPIQEAIKLSKTGKIAVLGVRSMIESEAMLSYAEKNRAPNSDVRLINASSLVELVETFTFINDPGRTHEVVAKFLADVRSANPNVDVVTMSSTHLPWLKPFFEAVAPDVVFLDPADTVLDQLDSYTSRGEGRTLCVATATEALPLEAFNAALSALCTPIRAQLKAS